MEEVFMNKYEFVYFCSEIITVIWFFMIVCSYFYRKKYGYGHFYFRLDKISFLCRLGIIVVLGFVFAAIFRKFGENILYSMIQMISAVIIFIGLCLYIFYRYKLVNGKGSNRIVKKYKFTKFVVSIFILIFSATAYWGLRLSSEVFL